MGATCGYTIQRPPIGKIDKFQAYLHSEAVMSYPTCDRFGEIQSLKTRKDGIYRLLMAAKLGKNTVKMDTISVQCRIMNSLADFQLYQGVKFDFQTSISPIFDHYDKNNTHVYFHITTAGNHNYMAKVSKFDSFRDVRLKQGLYQISLHQSLGKNQLIDYFIMNRGTMSALIIIFRYFQTSLLDLVMYRKASQGYAWNQTEVLFIWSKIIKGYRQLRENNIYHRDLRLGNIFFTPSNLLEPLQFINLSSARRLLPSELVNQDRQLLTVRGVSCFGQQLKGNIEESHELSDYDPHQHDIHCLHRLLLSILNLDPLEQNRSCQNQKFSKILAKIRSVRGPNQLVQIQQDLQRSLTSSRVNTNTIMDTDKEISADLAKKLLVRYHRHLIAKVYLLNLLLMHKRDAFNKFLLQKMQENEKKDKKEYNLDLLHQIGQYYESIGIADNDYYKEQILLVLSLAKQFRLEHFMENHQNYIEKAMVLMEKYRYRGNDLRISLKIEVVYSCLQVGDINEANQQLNALLNMAQKENSLELGIQADVLLAKAMVDTTCQKWESAQNTLEKAASIIKEGRNFVTQNEAKRIQGDLYMVQGYHYLRYIKQRRDQVPKPKYLGLAESSIKSALQTFSNLPETPTNTIRIVDAYLLQAGLQVQKQKFLQAKGSLDRCLLLIEELSTKHTIALSLRRIVYQKLKFVTSPTDPSYQTVIRRLNMYGESSLSNRETHHRMMSQINEGKKQSRHMRKLQKTVIITEEPEERERENEKLL